MVVLGTSNADDTRPGVKDSWPGCAVPAADWSASIPSMLRPPLLRTAEAEPALYGVSRAEFER